MPKKYNPETGKTALHLVGSISPSLQERRLTLGNHFADIVVSKREKNLCYFVLQRFGSAEILEMQRFEAGGHWKKFLSPQASGPS